MSLLLSSSHPDHIKLLLFKQGGLDSEKKRKQIQSAFFRILLHRMQLAIHLNSFHFRLKMVTFHLIAVSGYKFTSNCSCKRLL